jgi:hypothetical protein
MKSSVRDKLFVHKRIISAVRRVQFLSDRCLVRRAEFVIGVV